ncbi:MAG: class II fructose-bisphosphate aldolase family protein [Rhodospirillales bacterium]|nr:class II fructose-bisphosphate aldolase family protein [Rhodospirillales bacterium]
MTACSLTDVLKPAMDEGYAVAGLVVLGWEDALAYVEAAEETGIPVILQAGPGCRKHMPVTILGRMFRHLADQATVPVVCHIDHGKSLDECLEGIDNGFTSVMFDGSNLPISENIDLTAGLAEKAHAAGISVEGEVGYVGYADGATSAVTDPAEAERFGRESGADALAISIGNTHLQTEKSAGIDFGALAAIEAVTDMPLVLHGGSGIPIPVRRRLARDTRVCKFNIGTELRMAFGSALRETISGNPRLFDRLDLLKSTIPAVRTETAEVITNLRYPGGDR